MGWVEQDVVLARSWIHPTTWSPVIANTDQASTVNNAGPLRLVKASVRSSFRDELEGKRFRWVEEDDGDAIRLEIWETDSD